DREALAAGQRLKITDGLRANQHSESELFAGDGDVLSATAGELDENAIRAASLVKLAGGMEEPRTVAGGGGHMQRSGDGLANLGDLFVALRVLCEVLGDRDVVARLHFAEQRCQRRMVGPQ